MKDIDFDEIDRAVNSFIAGNSSVNDQNNNTALSPLSPSSVPVTSPAQPVVKSVSGQVSPLAGRRSGQFMDMVRPPQAAKSVPASAPTKQPVTATVPVSRQGVTVEPVSTEIRASVVTESKPEVTASVSSEVKNTWPDPIDFSESMSKLATEKAPVTASENADINKVSEETASGLPDSPFISGAKVEKRPLGAFSEGTATAQSNQEEPVEEPKPEPETPKPEPAQDLAEQTPKPVVFMPSNERDVDSPINTTTPLPAELQNDLLSIESDSTTNPNAVQASTVGKSIEGTTSISQQYQEKPSSGDQNTGAIYDTDSYHKALLHPVKKKSGWLWVLWIVLLLALGAGAGAAVYYFVLPNL